MQAEQNTVFIERTYQWNKKGGGLSSETASLAIGRHLLFSDTGG